MSKTKAKAKKPEKEKVFRINGSGLFFFLSNLTTDEKIEILDWYEGLSEKEKGYVETLRSEQHDETEYFTE